MSFVPGFAVPSRALEVEASIYTVAPSLSTVPVCSE